MAKLTAEQKALNKEATKLRDKSYRARRGAYQSELDAVRGEVESSKIQANMDQSVQDLDEMLDARDAAIAEIQAEIDALVNKKLHVQQEFESKLSSARDARNAAVNARNQALHEAEEKINAKYLDVSGCWSAAAWKPLEEFLPLVSAKSSE